MPLIAAGVGDGSAACVEMRGRHACANVWATGPRTMRDTSADRPTTRRQGLFPCKAEIAHRHSQPQKRWRQVARQLEREGLPKLDPIMGGRFWSAVAAFFRARGARCGGHELEPVQQTQAE
jgi:hypothetical protein